MEPTGGHNNDAPQANNYLHNPHQHRFYHETPPAQFGPRYMPVPHGYAQPVPLQHCTPPNGGYQTLQQYAPQLLGQYMQPHSYAQPRLPVLPPVQGYHTPYFNPTLVPAVATPLPTLVPAAATPLARQRPNEEP